MFFFSKQTTILFAEINTNQDSYPIDDIAPVLRRYLAWMASTSGVEQNFAKGERMKALGQTPAGLIGQSLAEVLQNWNR